MQQYMCILPHSNHWFMSSTMMQVHCLRRVLMIHKQKQPQQPKSTQVVPSANSNKLARISVCSYYLYNQCIFNVSSPNYRSPGSPFEIGTIPNNFLATALFDIPQ